MDDRIELLRRRITLYRCYLREGCSASRVHEYIVIANAGVLIAIGLIAVLHTL